MRLERKQEQVKLRKMEMPNSKGKFQSKEFSKAIRSSFAFSLINK